MNPETARAVLPGASGEPLPGLLSRRFSIGGTLSTLTHFVIDIKYRLFISITSFQRSFHGILDFSLKEI